MLLLLFLGDISFGDELFITVSIYHLLLEKSNKFQLILLALIFAGALALATTAAMPFAVLGAIEAAGATVTELAILGISAEALAGVAAGAAIGVGIVGKTAASIFSKDAGQSSGEITERNAGILLGEEHVGIQRPISAWKTWVKSV